MVQLLPIAYPPRHRRCRRPTPVTRTRPQRTRGRRARLVVLTLNLWTRTRTSSTRARAVGQDTEQQSRHTTLRHDCIPAEPRNRHLVGRSCPPSMASAQALRKPCVEQHEGARVATWIDVARVAPNLGERVKTSWLTGFPYDSNHQACILPVGFRACLDDSEFFAEK